MNEAGKELMWIGVGWAGVGVLLIEFMLIFFVGDFFAVWALAATAATVWLAYWEYMLRRRCFGARASAIGAIPFSAIAIPAAALLALAIGDLIRIVLPDILIRKTANFGLVISTTISVVAWLVLLGRVHAHHYLAMLAAHQGTLCHSCDYSLIGNRTGRCPECGALVPDFVIQRIREVERQITRKS